MFLSLKYSLAGFPAFLGYFLVSVLLLLAFKRLYARVTPHDEWELIREQQNSSAAVAFGGAIIGFALALASAASHSVGILDYIVWAIIALIAQLGAFALVRLLFMPAISERIENNEMAAGIMVAALSIAVGLLNAACMSY